MVFLIIFFLQRTEYPPDPTSSKPTDVGISLRKGSIALRKQGAVSPEPPFFTLRDVEKNHVSSLTVIITIKSRSQGSEPGAQGSFSAIRNFRKGKKHEIYLMLRRKTTVPCGRE